MGSLQACIAVYDNLVVRMKELEELRERLEKAKKLCAAMPESPKKKPASCFDTERAPTT
jgi:hypothetical protein